MKKMVNINKEGEISSKKKKSPTRMQSSRGTRQWAGDKSRDLRGRWTEGIRQTDGGNRLTADKGSRAAGIGALEIDMHLSEPQRQEKDQSWKNI